MDRCLYIRKCQFPTERLDKETSNQSSYKNCFYHNKYDFSATVCATTKSGANVDSELKLFSGEKKNLIIIIKKKNILCLNTCTPLSASHTYTQMLFVFKKSPPPVFPRIPCCFSQHACRLQAEEGGAKMSEVT